MNDSAASHRSHTSNKSGVFSPRRSVRVHTGDSLDGVSTPTVRSQANSLASTSSKNARMAPTTPNKSKSILNKKENAGEKAMMKQKKRKTKKRTTNGMITPIHSRQVSAPPELSKKASVRPAPTHKKANGHGMKLRKTVRLNTTHKTKRRAKHARSSTQIGSEKLLIEHGPHAHEALLPDRGVSSRVADPLGADDDEDDDDDFDDARSLSSVSSEESLGEDYLSESNNPAPVVNSNTPAFGGSWMVGHQDTSWLDGGSNHSISKGASPAPGTVIAESMQHEPFGRPFRRSPTHRRGFSADETSARHRHRTGEGAQRPRPKTFAARLVHHLSQRGPSAAKATPSMSIPIKSMRRLVSRNRSRYVDEEYDLDLSYVTPRVIAMGYPSSGLDKYYRNPASTVFRFFETNHQHHYRIYNLCINRRYPDKSELRPHVARFGFFDHNPCPMQTLRSLCLDIDVWLAEHPANIAAIHCKAGKGRTGLVVSAYLMHSGAVHNAEDAIRFFGNKRTKDGRGVTIPSQYRYVRYYELALKNEMLMRRIQGPVSAGVVFHLVAITFHSVDENWPGPHGHAVKVRVLAPDGVLMAKTKSWEYFPRAPSVPAEAAPTFAHGFELGKLGLSNTGEIIEEQSAHGGGKEASGVGDGVSVGVSEVVSAKPWRRSGHRRQRSSGGSGRVLGGVGNILFGGSSTLPGPAMEALKVPPPPPCGFAMVRPLTPVRVQGDTRLHVQFVNKRKAGTGNASTTMFQCWFNTNFLPVSSGPPSQQQQEQQDQQPDGPLPAVSSAGDFVLAGAVSPAELGESRARSCVSLLKIELDGKIRKDKMHKMTPANFVMAMHFVAAKSQPNVDLAGSGLGMEL